MSAARVQDRPSAASGVEKTIMANGVRLDHNHHVLGATAETRKRLKPRAKASCVEDEVCLPLRAEFLLKQLFRKG